MGLEYECWKSVDKMESKCLKKVLKRKSGRVEIMSLGVEGGDQSGSFPGRAKTLRV